MKQLVLLIICTIFPSIIFAQEIKESRYFNKDVSRKGLFMVSWGYNRAQYTKSNIHFKGDNYDFTLNKVKALDSPEKFNWKEYVSPVSLSIPQYNLGFTYYVKDNLSLSLNVDHMKYVMVQNQTVNINGTISGQKAEFNGQYNNDPKVMTGDFLTFEHTDGLNYLNIEIAKTQEIYGSKSRKFTIDGVYGVGAGALMPKSNVKLFSYGRNDAFHFAGFGLSGHLALNFIFFRKVFIQSNIKGGFIDMPDIVTRGTNVKDRAKQSFFFLQENMVFGVMFPIGKSKVK